MALPSSVRSLLVSAIILYFALFKKLEFSNPSLFSILGNVTTCLIIEDMWYYVIHRAMHQIPSLWQNVHQFRHQQTLYIHPLESGFWAFGHCLPLYVVRINDVFTFSIFLILKVIICWDAVPDSSLPVRVRNLLQSVPFYAGSDFHQFHYEKAKGTNPCPSVWSIHTLSLHVLSDWLIFREFLLDIQVDGHCLWNIPFLRSTPTITTPQSM